MYTAHYQILALQFLMNDYREGAKEVLAEYYKQIGGRPKKAAAKPGPKSGPARKRKSMGDAKSAAPAAAPAETKKRRKSAPKASTETPTLTEDNTDGEGESNWVPKGNNWDKDVDTVDTIIRDPGNNGLYALLLFNNGKKSRVSIETCYDKCPKKVSFASHQDP